MYEIIIPIMIPFIGTLLGSGCVFFLKKDLSSVVEKLLLGFASGVMIAASVWSLLIPAMDMSEHMGKLSFIPASVGFLLGIIFLYVLDHNVPHMHLDNQIEGKKANISQSMMLFFAVALHNIPEGMAVGVIFAGVLSGHGEVSMAGAIALSIGIAIQNFPEGAIISMPLKKTGISKMKAFLYGVASGIVEPIGAIITIALSSFIIPYIPYLLSFAAGSMMYVVVEELIPEGSQGTHSNLATIGFALGFVLMMILDVALG